jgi:histidinol-phosphatase (PHP family)
MCYHGIARISSASSVRSQTKFFRYTNVTQNMKCNYHTHTHFCDGKENMRFFVEKAIELQFDHLGFSPHAPISNQYDFTLTQDEIPLYLNEVELYQKQYPQIKIFKGMECDFIQGVTQDFSYYKNNYHLDYIIGGVHLVNVPHSNDIWFIDGPKRAIYDEGIARFFNHDIKKAVTCFWEQTYQMIETQKFDIIAHLDKIKMHNQNRFFKEDEPWYIKLVDHAIELIIKKNLIVEINSRGMYRLRCDSFYPSDYILKKLAQEQTPVIISSDAHRAEELPLYYEEAKAKLRSFGFVSLSVFENKTWKLVKM